MKYYTRSSGSLVVVAALLSFAAHFRAVRGVEPETGRDERRTLPLSTEYVGTYSRNAPPATVSWEGRVYDAADAIRVLTDLAGNMEASIWQRERALEFLQVFEYRLRGRKCIEGLLRLYSELPTGVEKAAVLACLSASEDPRAIPMFHTVLAVEKDHVLRLFAASGLAKWNIRAGVEELTRLLECGRSIRGRPRHTVRREASFVLMDLNAPKAWGFPNKEVLRSARRSTENRAQIRGMLIKRWKEWLAENEHRFPDWKLGDPLPEAKAATDRGE